MKSLLRLLIEHGRAEPNVADVALENFRPSFCGYLQHAAENSRSLPNVATVPESVCPFATVAAANRKWYSKTVPSVPDEVLRQVRCFGG